jgi:hypothetical protein
MINYEHVQNQRRPHAIIAERDNRGRSRSGRAGGVEPAVPPQLCSVAKRFQAITHRLRN